MTLLELFHKKDNLRTYLEENALNGNSDAIRRVLSSLFVAVQSRHGLVNQVFQVSSGAIITQSLPNETRRVE